MIISWIAKVLDLLRLEIKQFVRDSYDHFHLVLFLRAVCLKPSNRFANLLILALDEILQVLALFFKFCFHMVNARLEWLNPVTDVSPEAAIGVFWRANLLGEHAKDASHDHCGSNQPIP